MQCCLHNSKYSLRDPRGSRVRAFEGSTGPSDPGAAQTSTHPLSNQLEESPMHYLPHIFIAIAGGASVLVFLTSPMF